MRLGPHKSVCLIYSGSAVVIFWVWNDNWWCFPILQASQKARDLGEKWDFIDCIIRFITRVWGWQSLACQIFAFYWEIKAAAVVSLVDFCGWLGWDTWLDAIEAISKQSLEKNRPCNFVLKYIVRGSKFNNNTIIFNKLWYAY